MWRGGDSCWSFPCPYSLPHPRAYPHVKLKEDELLLNRPEPHGVNTTPEFEMLQNCALTLI